jgi:hypothetical protein
LKNYHGGTGTGGQGRHHYETGNLFTRDAGGGSIDSLASPLHGGNVVTLIEVELIIIILFMVVIGLDVSTISKKIGLKK